MTDIRQSLDKLAEHVANKASLGDTALSESTDALKALTTYYALLLKQKVEPDEADEPTFAQLARDIEGTKDGRAVPAGRDARRRYHPIPIT